MKKQKAFAILLAICMMVTATPTIGFAETIGSATEKVETTNFIDMPNDWSTVCLQKAVTNGIMTGYDTKFGKTIQPTGNLTRAEMATMVNRSFGATEKASIVGVTDVPAHAWFATEVAKAIKMGTFKADTEMRPKDKITRQEAFTVLARALKVQCNDKNSALNNLSDKESISAWAKDGICGLVEAGYVTGADGKLRPNDTITRAEFAKVMDNTVKQYIKTAGVCTEVVASGNVMVNVPGVTLQNLTITGDLLIGDGVGDGDVILDHVKVTGRVVVRGGTINNKPIAPSTGGGSGDTSKDVLPNAGTEITAWSIGQYENVSNSYAGVLKGKTFTFTVPEAFRIESFYSTIKCSEGATVGKHQWVDANHFQVGVTAEDGKTTSTYAGIIVTSSAIAPERITSAHVNSYEEFKFALESENVRDMAILKDMEISESLVIDKHVFLVPMAKVSIAKDTTIEIMKSLRIRGTLENNGTINIGGYDATTKIATKASIYILPNEDQSLQGDLINNGGLNLAYHEDTGYIGDLTIDFDSLELCTVGNKSDGTPVNGGIYVQLGDKSEFLQAVEMMNEKATCAGIRMNREKAFGTIPTISSDGFTIPAGKEICIGEGYSLQLSGAVLSDPTRELAGISVWSNGNLEFTEAASINGNLRVVGAEGAILIVKCDAIDILNEYNDLCTIAKGHYIWDEVSRWWIPTQE